VDCGSRPELNKAEEVVGEIFARMRYFLGTEKLPSGFWECRDFKSAKHRIEQVHSMVAYPLVHPACTLKNTLRVLREREDKAARRAEGIQLLLKVVECSKHFSQSLLMAGLLLQVYIDTKAKKYPLFTYHSSSSSPNGLTILHPSYSIALN
jgi:hypothetical protein